jgi:glycosyltransferase involved in cell wall biosynthesis
MDGSASEAVIAIVLKGYPRLSETFIAQELLALEARGLPLVIYSLRHPAGETTHPVHADIRAAVHYLPEFLHDDPARVWRGWRTVRDSPHYADARSTWLRDLARDRTASRVRRFGQALVLAAEMERNVVHMHAHFLHTPASVARYAAMLRGLPWSVSAHAKDIWTIPDWEKREKLDSCVWSTTCTAANVRHLRGLVRHPDDVDLVYHGIDAARFPAPAADRDRRDGNDPARPVTILSVGRAVDKKGVDDLLSALALLPHHLYWRFVHVGAGPLLPELAKKARELRLEHRVEWRGPQPLATVLDAYRGADIFALPCRIAADGDRDGLPNVLLEAQSQKLPCVSTPVSGIPELIQDGITGLLVEPRAPAKLADSLARLIREPALRRALGEAGYVRTLEMFSMHPGADRLAARFAACLTAR